MLENINYISEVVSLDLSKETLSIKFKLKGHGNKLFGIFIDHKTESFNVDGKMLLSFIKDPLNFLYNDLCSNILESHNKDIGSFWTSIVNNIIEYRNKKPSERPSFLYASVLTDKEYFMYHAVKDVFMILEKQSIPNMIKAEKNSRTDNINANLFEDYRYLLELFRDELELEYKITSKNKSRPNFKGITSKGDLIGEVSNTLLSNVKFYIQDNKANAYSIYNSSPIIHSTVNLFMEYYISTRNIKSELIKKNIRDIIYDPKADIECYGVIPPNLTSANILSFILVNRNSEKSLEMVSKLIDKTLEVIGSPIFLSYTTVTNVLDISRNIEDSFHKLDIENYIDRITNLNRFIYDINIFESSNNANRRLPRINSNRNIRCIHAYYNHSIDYRSSNLKESSLRDVLNVTYNESLFRELSDLLFPIKRPLALFKYLEDNNIFLVDASENKIVRVINEEDYTWNKDGAK